MNIMSTTFDTDHTYLFVFVVVNLLYILLLQEEVQMVQEVLAHGRVLNMAALNSKGGIEKAAMAITVDNFDPNSFDIRPPAWSAIRLRRAIAKEEVGRTLKDVEYVRNRPMRVMEVCDNHSLLLVTIYFYIFLS